MSRAGRSTVGAASSPEAVQAELNRIGPRVFTTKVNELCIQLPRPPPCALDTSEAPAREYLLRCIDALHGLAANQASGLPRAHWLILTRLVPYHRFNAAPAIQIGTRAAAEHLTGTYGRREGSVPETLGWPAAELRLVIRFVATVYMMELYRGVQSAVARGGTLRPWKRGDLPQVDFPPEAQEAEDLFAARASADGLAPRSRIGAQVSRGPAIHEITDDDFDGLLDVLWLGRFEDQLDWSWLVAAAAQGGQNTTDVFMRAQYAPGWNSLEELLEQGPTLLATALEEHRAQHVILLLLMRALTMDAITLEGAWSNALWQFGIMIKPRLELRDYLDRTWAMCEDWLRRIDPAAAQPSVANFVEVLTSLTDVGAYPYYGAPLLEADDALVVDAAALNTKWQFVFSELLASAPGGERGRHFEGTVRSVVAASGWAPSPYARQIVGERPCRDGRKIETDAVAERGDTLILIEAKSYPRTGTYELGDWNKMSRRAQQLEADLDHHNDRRHRLMMYGIPQVDIRRWSQILAVVCTPGPFWLPAGESIAEVYPGLRSICTLAELESALAAI